MRIRDATISKWRQTATTALLCICRCREVDASITLTSYFLQVARNVLAEEGLATERKLSIQNTTFCLDSLDDCECPKRFRFTTQDIYRITALLQWPEEMNKTKRRRYQTNAILSFCIVCRRLGIPCRWWDLESEFGMMTPQLDEICCEGLDYLHQRFGSLVQTYRDEFIQNRAVLYADCNHKAGAPLESCVGFINATNILISRRRRTAQRPTYGGHKRRNALKFQAIGLPDGLILHLSGPAEGCRHDMTLFRRSKVSEDLQRRLLFLNRQFNIYGDPAYVLRPYLQVEFKSASITEEQLEFKKRISTCRVVVEWAFKNIKNILRMWTCQEKCNQKDACWTVVLFCSHSLELQSMSLWF